MTNAEDGKCDARASPTRRHPPYALPPPTLPRLGGRVMPWCGGSQCLQRGEEPELRGQAAAQAVPVKVPARGAPERDHGGNSDERGGRQVRRARFPTRRHTLRALPPLPCHGLEAGVPRCGGSQSRQRRELAKLRGHAAAQVVALKLPARKAPEQDHGGNGDERRGWQVQRVRLPCAPPFSAPSQPLP